MSMSIGTVKEAATDFQLTLQNAGVNNPKPYQRAMKRFRALLSDGCTSIRKAHALVDEEIRRDLRAIRKSEAESTRDAESNDFNYPPTPGQRAAAETRALAVRGLAQAATRRLQQMGVENPTSDDYDRAIQDVINVSLVDYSGVEPARVDSNPQLAARMRERPDDTIWEPLDLADVRQRDMVDEQAEFAKLTNFMGERNQGYSNQRREMGSETSFSSGASPGADLNVATIAAAFASGVRAGAAKSRRGRR